MQRRKLTIKQKLLNNISKQYNIGTFIGAMKEIAQHTIFWVSIINFLLLAATAYNTTIFPWAIESTPWLSFIAFFSILTVLVCFAMIMEYKFIMPSVLTFRNRQMGKFEFPTKEEIDRLSAKIDKLLELYENSTHK